MDKNNRKKWYLKIQKLFVTIKNSALIKESSEYLYLFPNDIDVRLMRAKVYRKTNEYEKAINDFKYILNIKKEENALANLYFLYYYLYMYKEALELLPLLYETRCINPYSLAITELVIKKQLGLDTNFKRGARCDYLKEQIVDYKEGRAINHIQGHFIYVDEKKSCFNENVNLNYLFNLIKNNIDNKNKGNFNETLEIYYFGVSNVGYVDNTTCNYIKVVVVPNTNNIVNMYPVNTLDYKYISNIDIDYEKLFKSEKTKTMSSRIDKFNKKYNLK